MRAVRAVNDGLRAANALAPSGVQRGCVAPTTAPGFRSVAAASLLAAGGSRMGLCEWKTPSLEVDRVFFTGSRSERAWHPQTSRLGMRRGVRGAVRMNAAAGRQRPRHIVAAGRSVEPRRERGSSLLRHRPLGRLPSDNLTRRGCSSLKTEDVGCKRRYDVSAGSFVDRPIAYRNERASSR